MPNTKAVKQEVETTFDIQSDDVLPNELSDVKIEDLIAGKSGKQQKEIALKVFQEIQTEICNETDNVIKARTNIKKINDLIKRSELGQKKAQLESVTKTYPKLIASLNNRRAGALQMCERLGIDVTKELRNMKQIKAQ